MQFLAPYRLFPDALHLHPDHMADLRKSGLNDRTIRAGGVYSIAPKFIAEFFKKTVPVEIETALCFPYQGGDFARIKIFPPLGKMKYAQPPGTSARLYLPLSVTDGVLYIVEGEKKPWRHIRTD